MRNVSQQMIAPQLKSLLSPDLEASALPPDPTDCCVLWADSSLKKNATVRWVWGKRGRFQIWTEKALELRRNHLLANVPHYRRAPLLRASGYMRLLDGTLEDLLCEDVFEVAHLRVHWTKQDKRNRYKYCRNAEGK